MRAALTAIVTFGGVGLVPVAPGTFGSAAAVLAAWLLHWLGSFPLLAAATLAVTLAGIPAIARYEARAETGKDPGEVVIDEVAGQWIALLPLSWGLWAAGSAAHVFPWQGWLPAFLLFRLFDIWKPGPIGWADRRGDAAGVMLDDVFAGVFAAILVTLMAGFAHGWFG